LTYILRIHKLEIGQVKGTVSVTGIDDGAIDETGEKIQFAVTIKISARLRRQVGLPSNEDSCF